MEPDTEDNIITEDEQLDDPLDHEQDLTGPSERVVGTSKLRLIDGYRPPDVTSGGDSPVEWREVDIHNSVAP